MSDADIDLILVDPKEELCHAWRTAFGKRPGVSVVCGRFEELPEFDCMVSAANSFGLMDGGVDLAITRFFGVQLMERVQTRILEEYLGEQPIGTSFIIETRHPKHPFIAHTPTMRVPMAIATTDNVYSAMWAMLLAVRRHNAASTARIRQVACPGLGTATGRVAPDEAARQMALAYNWYLRPLKTIDWLAAQSRQAAIGRGGDLALDPYVEIAHTSRPGTTCRRDHNLTVINRGPAAEFRAQCRIVAASVSNGKQFPSTSVDLRWDSNDTASALAIQTDASEDLLLVGESSQQTGFIILGLLCQGAGPRHDPAEAMAMAAGHWVELEVSVLSAGARSAVRVRFSVERQDPDPNGDRLRLRTVVSRAL